MNLKLILLIILIISTSIIFSTTTTKKTTKKIIKKTTHKKTTNKLIKITTKAKSNESVSECYESYDSSYLKYENKTKCNSTCSTYKNVKILNILQITDHLHFPYSQLERIW